MTGGVMNRILWHAIRYDIREGILKKFLYFLVLIAVILYFVVSSAMILSNTQGNCSVTDIFLYLWRGSPKPVLQRGQTFEIPIFYLFLHVFQYLYLLLLKKTLKIQRFQGFNKPRI